MNRKLETIKPYIKSRLQFVTGQSIKDNDIDVLCNKGKIISVEDMGEGYVLVSESRLEKRSELSDMLCIGRSNTTMSDRLVNPYSSYGGD